MDIWASKIEITGENNYYAKAYSGSTNLRAEARVSSSSNGIAIATAEDAHNNGIIQVDISGNNSYRIEGGGYYWSYNLWLGYANARIRGTNNYVYDQQVALSASHPRISNLLLVNYGYYDVAGETNINNTTFSVSEYFREQVIVIGFSREVILGGDINITTSDPATGFTVSSGIYHFGHNHASFGLLDKTIISGNLNLTGATGGLSSFYYTPISLEKKSIVKDTSKIAARDISLIYRANLQDEWRTLKIEQGAALKLGSDTNYMSCSNDVETQIQLSDVTTSSWPTNGFKYSSVGNWCQSPNTASIAPNGSSSINGFATQGVSTGTFQDEDMPAFPQDDVYINIDESGIQSLIEEPQ